MAYANMSVVSLTMRNMKLISRSRGQTFLLTREEGVHRRRKLFPALEEFEFEEEDEAQEVTAHFLDKFTSRLCRSAYSVS